MPAVRPTLHRFLATLAAAVPLASLGLAAPAGAAVVISQVYGGGGNSGATYSHDYVELRNTGTSAVSLAGWSLQYGAAGSSTWSVAATLTGSIPAGGFYLVRLGSSNTGVGAALPVAADASGGQNISGANGKLVLASQATALAAGACPAGNLVDFVGFGTANCAEGTAAPAGGNSTALLRDAAGGGCADSGNNAADFSVAGSFVPRHAASGAQACDGSSGGGGGNTGGDGTAASVGIPAIQGRTGTSPHVGQQVVTGGVVTRLVNNGFFLQALVGDGDDATSDGIFVFTSSAPTVQVGQLLQVTARVGEFATAGGTVTQLTSPVVTVQGSGYSLAPTPVSLPVAGGLERFEGMLVTLAGPLTVGQNYFQARFGQLTLSAGGRLETPTNRHRPGPQAQAQMADNAARRIVLQDGSSVQNVNPTPFTGPNGALRGGDTIGAITGVIDWGPSTSTASGPGDWRIIPLNPAALQYGITHPRPTSVPAVGGNLKLASFNVLNYFTTFTDGRTVGGQTGQGCRLGSSVSAANCRGANNLAEFQRQQAKIVAALSAIDADAVGLMEIQNDSVSAQDLVAALNARLGAGTYAVAPGAAAGVVGSDAIKTTILFKPSKLAPLAGSLVDNSTVNSRPTVAQGFALANGERFTLVVNHFKSKGSCPAGGDADAAGNTDSGDGQGCWNALRTAQAHQLRSFVAQLQAASGSNDVVIVGDLNAYGQEDPVHALTSNGYVDQIGRFNGFGYSYVFDGAAGRLDHAITTASASPKVSGALLWHINADESLAHDYNLEFKQPACATCAPDPSAATVYRSSDHDPVLLGLNLYKTVRGSSGRELLQGSAGDDLLIGGAGADVLSGNGGADVFVYTALADAGDTITDFVPGDDRLDLRALLAALGVQPAQAIAGGVVRFAASGANTLVQIDADGSAGSGAARTLVTLRNVSPAALVAARDLILQ